MFTYVIYNLNLIKTHVECKNEIVPKKSLISF